MLQVTVPREEGGLGLSLVGNKDRHKMSVFVLALDEDNLTTKHSGIQLADELLEVHCKILTGKKGYGLCFTLILGGFCDR